MAVIPTSRDSKAGYLCRTVTYPSGKVVYIPTSLYLRDILQPRLVEMELCEIMFKAKR